MVPKVWCCGVLTVVAFVFFSAVGAQEPRFASVTIRPSTMSAGERSVSRVEPDGAYTAANVTLVQLIEAAYRRSLGDQREVSGGPDWVRTDRFDVYAKVDGVPALDDDGFPRQSLRMLQELLKERFHLQRGVMPQERPAYALVSTGKAGTGLIRSTLDCAAQVRARARGEQIEGPPCGAAPYQGRLVARGVAIKDLAALIAPWVGKPVIDRTGLTGLFDVDVEGVEFRPRGPVGPSHRPSETKESILSTVRSQLGLQLQPINTTIEVLVINHAEKPPPEKDDEARQPVWRDPSPHQQQMVAVEPSVRLEVLDWGGSGPPLVFLACYISAHTYDEIAPKLTNQFHVYGITRRGVGASDKPATGYDVQQSVNDVIEVLDALQIRKALVVGHSCAGQIQTMLTARHSDRLLGLVYLDGAGDPTMTAADVGAAMPDPKMLPAPITPRSAPDNTSFDALRASQRRDRGWAFPEGELRQQFSANPDGSVGGFLLSPTIRRAITMDARVKPNYSHVKVPVLAIYQKDPPFEQVAANHLIRNEQERAALRQEHAATRALYVRWQRDLLAAVPSARIVELEGASLYMFLSNEADIIRELRAFAALLR